MKKYDAIGSQNAREETEKLKMCTTEIATTDQSLLNQQ